MALRARYQTGQITGSNVQGSAKMWVLGCVNLPPADMDRGSQEAGFTQSRAHLLADPCRFTDFNTALLNVTRDVEEKRLRWFLFDLQ